MFSSTRENFHEGSSPLGYIVAFNALQVDRVSSAFDAQMKNILAWVTPAATVKTLNFDARDVDERLEFRFQPVRDG